MSKKKPKFERRKSEFEFDKLAKGLKKEGIPFEIKRHYANYISKNDDGTERKIKKLYRSIESPDKAWTYDELPDPDGVIEKTRFCSFNPLAKDAKNGWSWFVSAETALYLIKWYRSGRETA